MQQVEVRRIATSEKLRIIAQSVQAALFCLSVLVFTTGSCFNDLSIQLLGVVLLFAANCIYAILHIHDHLLFLFLHGGIALFLLTRPTIGYFSEGREWFLGTFDATEFALTIIFVSMLFLFLGTLFYGVVRAHNERERARREKLAPQGPGARLPLAVLDAIDRVGTSEKWYYIRIASYLCFLVCFCASCLVGLIKLSYMAGLSYEDYYLIEVSDHVPWALGILNVMMPYMFCSYLATLPRRRGVMACFALYIASTLPMLMIGSRSDFVIAFLFLIFYFIFRQATDKEQVWISRQMVVIALAAGFLGVLMMGFWDYLRAEKTGTMNLDTLGLFADALFKQGVSFTVLGHGYDVNGMIQDLGFKFYTMGDLITTLTQGFIGQTFFHCDNLGSTNSALLALNGHSYAHAMSFFAHPNYLGGEGYGSSYMLELYADFGFVGVILGSFIISLCLRGLNNQLGKSWFGGMVALISVSSVIHMARGYAIEWICFVWSTRFLLAVGILVFASALLYFVSSYGHRVKQVADDKNLNSAIFDFKERQGEVHV